VSRIPAELVLLVFLGALVLWFTVNSPFFLSFGNFRNILLSVAVLGVLAMPSTLLLVSGNFDLSVASAAAFSGMLFALYGADHGYGSAIVVALAAGLGIGILNGFLVARVGINSIITTLGTLSVFRGLAKLLSNGQTIRLDGFVALGSGSTVGIPNPVIALAVVFGVLYVTMRYTVFGRSVYAIGSSPQAARLSGIRSQRNLFIVFALTGLLAGFAGLILTSQLRAASPIAGLGLELSVVAAVILGGASLAGGRGTVVGTLLGVLILGTLNNGLTITNISSFWQEVVSGVVLILAVGLDQLRLRLGRST
jgi:ribose transport system permease protein